MKRKVQLIAAAAAAGCLLFTQGIHYADSTASTSADQQAQSADAEGEASAAAPAPAPVPAMSDDMEIAAENEALVLYVNPQTTEIAVRDKRNDSMWYSNPADRQNDPIATGYNKDKLNVQFEISYFDSKGNLLKYDNYTHSVQNRQFELEKTNDGLKIVYTLGDAKSEIDTIPKYIGEERFQTVILDKIEDPKDKREVEKRFKYNEEEKRYERRDSTFNNIGLSKVGKIFEQIGYDEEQKAIDNAAYGEETEGSVNVTVPIVYRLDGEHLTVTVPGKEVEYPAAMKIQSISLLPFFGASGQNDKGYTLVPDGSGALIHFNNEKTYADPFRTTLYGSDSAMKRMMKIQKDETARLPVFGMKYEDRAFVAIIEKGDGVASIEADVSGRVNAYNTVSSSFTFHSAEEVTLTNGWRSSTVKKFQREPFQGDIGIRYGFLGEEAASYSGMAALYRDYLVKHKGLTKLENEQSIPFFLELIGGIPKKKFFLGVPYNAYEPLTTFEQAEAVLSQMRGKGIGNIKLRYTGWFNNGVDHDFPKSVSVDKKLGGEKGLDELSAYAGENNVALFPDAAFLEVAAGARGFNRSSQASRLITGKLAQIYPYDVSDFREDTDQEPGYVLSPKVLPEAVDGFMKDYVKLNLSGLSLRDLGDKLNSDFNRSEVIDRDEAKRIVTEQLADMKDAGMELLVEGGNGYAVPYARNVVNAPLSSSGYHITDESVPFFQLVYHGYVNYAGDAWNMASDQDSTYNFLKALETGSTLNYTWFYADSSAVKQTSFDHFYSADYRRWIDEAAERYGELNDILHDVQTQTMNDHRRLADGVYQTTFEEGKTIIVNYNDRGVTVNGVSVGANDYWVGGEKR